MASLEEFDFDFDVPTNIPQAYAYEYYKNLKNREIWLDTDVDMDAGTMNIVHQIIRWNREDKDLPVEKRKPIMLYCFSYGGDLDICNAIIDAITISKTPVYGINAGRCCSAAAFIFLACHKRFMLEHSYFLFHQGSAMFGGDYSKLDSQMEDYKKQVEELSNIMKSYTTFSEEDIKNKITKEWYVRKDEALENGVCDFVLEDFDSVIF